MNKKLDKIVGLLTFRNNNENNRFHEIAHGFITWLQIISVVLIIFLIVR